MRIAESQFIPKWAHSIVLRGVEVPLLSPMEAQADNAMQGPSGLRHAPARLWRRLELWWSGTTAVEWVRGELAPLVPPEHRPIISTLSGGELLRLRETYHALQQEFYAAMREGVIEAARAEGRRIGAAAAGKAPVVPPAPAPAKVGVIPIEPGAPLPSALGGRKWGRLRGDDEPPEEF